MKYNGNVKVISKEFIKEDIYRLTVKRPRNIEIKAGQFFMIKTISKYPLLNRPISVSRYSESEIEFTIKIVGKETKKMSLLTKGDSVYLLGPSGNGFEFKDTFKNVLIVGGGIGIEPLKSAAMELDRKNINTTAFLGFRDEGFDIEILKRMINNVIIFSEVENKGDYKGYPTDLLSKELSDNRYDAVFTCGPSILMNKVNDICKNNNVEVQMLLEEKMACGIGACLGCTCDTKTGYKKVCTDGPMFYGSEVK